MHISSTYDRGRLTVYLQGELDQHSARDAMEDIDRIIDEYMPRDCALDLSGLGFMDSSGIALILKTHRRLLELGGRAWVENAVGQPLKVIDAAGIERLINIVAMRGA